VLEEALDEFAAGVFGSFFGAGGGAGQQARNWAVILAMGMS